jgi:hypothetical protein
MLMKRARELAELQSQHGQALRSVEDLAQLLAMWKPGVYTKEREEVYLDSRYAARERQAYPHPAMAAVLDKTHGQVLYAVMWTLLSMPPIEGMAACALLTLRQPSPCCPAAINGPRSAGYWRRSIRGEIPDQLGDFGRFNQTLQRSWGHKNLRGVRLRWQAKVAGQISYLALHKRCPRRAGAHRVHGDSVLRAVDGSSASETDQPVLGGDVAHL